MKRSNLAEIHDMRTCLALGKTPEKPIYFGNDASVAESFDALTITDNRTRRTLLSGIFSGGRSFERLVQATIEGTLQKIYRFIDMKTDFGLNPLSDLRKVFPELTWSFHEIEGGNRESLALKLSQSKTSYIWNFAEGSFTAKHKVCPGKFCCTAFNKNELESELVILSNDGYVLVNVED